MGFVECCLDGVLLHELLAFGVEYLAMIRLLFSPVLYFAVIVF